MDDISEHVSAATLEYNGIQVSQIRPVFQAACRLRFTNPQPDHTIAITRTRLEIEVVSAIIAGAVRLVPRSKNPAERATQIQKQRARSEKAAQAEQAFVERMRIYQPRLMDEQAQKNAFDRPSMTPDILFLTPTVVKDVLCRWIEYKDSFGFQADPYVFKKTRKQVRSYVMRYGSGMIVYMLGFQVDLLSIEGVTCLREAEVLSWIRAQGQVADALQTEEDDIAPGEVFNAAVAQM